VTGEGWYSVTITSLGDPEMIADLLWSFGPPAVEERAGPDEAVMVTTGFSDLDTARRAANAVTDRGLGLAEVTVVIDDGLDGWRTHAEVELAAPFAVIPAWLDVEAPVGFRPLLIEPGPTFGSGSHPTTRLVLSRMAQLLDGFKPEPGDRGDVTVLDVGCGSGILAVGAALLGARSVGMDIDQAAGSVTLANAERNGVTPLVSFDSRPIEEIARCGRDGDGFDLVVANLLAPVIRDLGPALVAATSPGGALVVSGLLADRWAEAVATLEDRDMTVEAVDEDEGWVAVVLLHRVRHARLPAAT
jgi:ribosomal protein L11 methyltransferase